MENNNENSVYSYLEIIRKAANELEKIHVYETNSAIYGSSKEEELKIEIGNLNNQILEYEIQLADLQKMVDSAIELNKSLYDANGKLIEANNKLISEKKLAEENKELAIEQAEKIIEVYNRLPKIVKRMYGVK
jgi:hypothetical protein